MGVQVLLSVQVQKEARGIPRQDLCKGSPCADSALSNHTGVTPDGVSDSNSAVARLNIDIDELNKKIAQKDEEVKLYKGRYEDTSRCVAELRKQLSEGNTQDGATSALLQERSALLERVSALELKVKTLQAENERLSEEKGALETSNKTMTEENHTLHSQFSVSTASRPLRRGPQAEKEVAELKADVENQTKEQDDLLVLLAEQDTKMKAYRTRLKELGEKVWLLVS
ncbi:hypothetical protein NP493_786g01119 [Ridgeia piscesae]|uniref:Uso1/p115-like vesicle tethering protein C-terminal domain-containing protein n=1 Tax=Ridgeia piscesae TaxID=27915 RepID=A0AAD9KNZ7_RIDPI|nr:hypothetical protein NP493_786g01119 [Ridgeia piscesae]